MSHPPSSFDQGQPPPHPQQPAGQGQFGQGYPSQAPYGQPQPGPYGPPAQYGQPYGMLPEHPQGTMILVLGCLGFLTGICGAIAWYMGNKAQKEIRASGVRYSNESNINVGRILGIVTTILAAVSIVLVIVYFIVMTVLLVGVMGTSPY